MPTATILASLLPLGARTLEIGAAKGYLIAECRRVGLESYGVDISQYAVDKCVEVSKPYLQQLNAANPLPVHDDKLYECVLSMEVLEHIYEDEVAKVLKEMEAVLMPGGLLVHRICLEDVDMEPDNDHTHVTVKPRNWWEEKFYNLGWEIDKAAQNIFDSAFINRDWHGRFFVWRTPSILIGEQ